MHSAGRVRRTVLAHALDVCKTENQTRDTTHGGARRKAPSPACPKRPFTTQADRLRPRLDSRRRVARYRPAGGAGAAGAVAWGRGARPTVSPAGSCLA